jgi:hypothetical protein
MQFLNPTECNEWCQRHGFLPPDQFKRLIKTKPLPVHEFNIPCDAGRRVTMSRALWKFVAHAEEHEQLIWMVEWGVWLANEHMPLFDRLRSSFGETRPLIEAPGQVVQPNEEEDGLSFLVIAAVFLWDCWVYSTSGAIAMLSHDEFGMVYEPREEMQADIRQVLANIAG